MICLSTDFIKSRRLSGSSSFKRLPDCRALRLSEQRKTWRVGSRLVFFSMACVQVGTLGILKVVGHRQAATAIRTTFRGGPKSQKPMDGRQKPFCGENKVDKPLGFCSGMPKTPRFFDSDRQNDEFWGF